MSSIKSHLKRAREAIASKDWPSAESSCLAALDLDSRSYNALVFLALARFNLGNIPQAVSDYRSAVSIDPDQLLAYQGLASLYDHQLSQDSDCSTLQELLNVYYRLLELYNQKADAVKLAETVSKMLALPNKTRNQSISILSIFLPDSSYQALLSTLVGADIDHKNTHLMTVHEILRHGSLSPLKELVALVKSEQSQAISAEISKRRHRLTSTPKTHSQTANEVILEYYPHSQLPKLWDLLLNHPDFSNDLERREVEIELLSFHLDWLKAFPPSDSHRQSPPAAHADISPAVKIPGPADPPITSMSQISSKVEEIARGIVILKIAHQPSWDVVIDWGQVLGPGQRDDPQGYLKSLCDLMPDSALARMVVAFDHLNARKSIEEDETDLVDPLESLEAGFVEARDHSILAHLLVVSVYQDLKDYLNVIEVADQGMSKLAKLEKLTGKKLSKFHQVFSYHLALALTFMDPPSHHPRATGYLDQLLAEQGANPDCLLVLAKARVLEHAQLWEQAVKFFTLCLEGNVSNLHKLNTIETLDVRSGRAWCLFELGRVEEAAADFEDIIKDLEKLSHSGDAGEVGLGAYHLAQSWYRLGRCHWSKLNDDLAPTDRDQLKELARSCFIKSIRCDTTLAASFTYLGLYYSEQRDHARSSKCFQKAFELDPSQEIAAFRLATEFADQREWDLVEVIVQKSIRAANVRVYHTGTDSSQQSPLSLKHHSLAGYRRFAWAWKALGVVQLSKGQFAAAQDTFQDITAFSPEDVQAWTMFALALRGTGKHVTALKAFLKARELSLAAHQTGGAVQQSWYLDFCIAHCQRQIGLLEPAIILLEEIIQSQPADDPHRWVMISALVETKYALAMKRARLEGDFVNGEHELIGCLAMVCEVLEASKSRITLKSHWKLVGDILIQLGRWHKTIPMETFNMESTSMVGRDNEKLKTGLSLLINLAAKLNVDGYVNQVNAVTCLEVSGLAAENGSSGLLIMSSIVCYKVRLMFELMNNDHAGSSSSSSEQAGRDFRRLEPAERLDLGYAWQDLAVSLGTLADWLVCHPTPSLGGLSTRASAQVILTQAIQSVRNALALQPHQAQHWNILGCLSFKLFYHRARRNFKSEQPPPPSPDRVVGDGDDNEEEEEEEEEEQQLKKSASLLKKGSVLAQHCWIKALEADVKNHISWTYLGYLYQIHRQWDLAQEAFLQAVALDADFGLAWLGLGLQDSLESSASGERLMKENTNMMGQTAHRYGDKKDRSEVAFDYVRHAYELPLLDSGCVELSFTRMAVEVFLSRSYKGHDELEVGEEEEGAEDPSCLAGLMLRASRNMLRKSPDDPMRLNLRALILERLSSESMLIGQRNWAVAKVCTGGGEEKIRGWLRESVECLERSKEVLEERYEVDQSVELEGQFMKTNLNLGRIKLLKKKGRSRLMTKDEEEENEDCLEDFEVVKSLRGPFDLTVDGIDRLHSVLSTRCQARYGIALDKVLDLGSLAEREVVDIVLEEVEGGLKELGKVRDQLLGSGQLVSSCNSKGTKMAWVEECIWGFERKLKVLKLKLMYLLEGMEKKQNSESPSLNLAYEGLLNDLVGEELERMVRAVNEAKDDDQGRGDEELCFIDIEVLIFYLAWLVLRCLEASGGRLTMDKVMLTECDGRQEERKREQQKMMVVGGVGGGNAQEMSKEKEEERERRCVVEFQSMVRSLMGGGLEKKRLAGSKRRVVAEECLVTMVRFLESVPSSWCEWRTMSTPPNGSAAMAAENDWKNKVVKIGYLCEEFRKKSLLRDRSGWGSHLGGSPSYPSLPGGVCLSSTPGSTTRQTSPPTDPRHQHRHQHQDEENSLAREDQDVTEAATIGGESGGDGVRYHDVVGELLSGWRKLCLESQLVVLDQRQKGGGA